MRIIQKVKKLKKYLTLSDFKIKLFTGMTGFAAHSITKILERKKLMTIFLSQ